MQSGRPKMQFNPYFVYGLINGGRDAGAMISDALRALMQYGVCQQEALPSGVMFQNQFPPQAFENAKRFKLIKAYRCANFNEICSAISVGYVCPLGILVGQNFPQIDSEGVAPLPNGGGGGHCVLPETIIAGPEMKKASDVVVGDYVFTDDGKENQVTEIFKRYFNGNLAKIVSNSGTVLTVTEDHPVLVYRRKRQNVPVMATVGAIAECDSPAIYKAWERFESVWVSAKDVRPGDYLVTPKIKARECDENIKWLTTEKATVKLPEVKLDADLAWLFGYYIGDGNNLCNKGIEFSVCDQRHADKILACLKKLGLKSKVVYRGTNGKTVTEHDWTSIKIRTHSVSLAKSFVHWFGKRSADKHIPGWLLFNQFSESLLEGLIDADGCRHKNNVIFQTTSKVLAQQVKMIATSLGKCPLMQKTSLSQGSFANAKRAWIVKWTIGAKWKITRETDDHLLFPVRAMYLLPYSGDVYNYEVEDRHNYLADTFVVHNCILGMGLKKSARYGWLIKVQNSWGVRFGRNGYCYIHAGHFRAMNPDAFAIQLIADDPLDNTPQDEVPVVSN